MTNSFIDGVVEPHNRCQAISASKSGTMAFKCFPKSPGTSCPIGHVSHVSLVLHESHVEVQRKCPNKGELKRDKENVFHKVERCLKEENTILEDLNYKYYHIQDVYAKDMLDLR